MTIPGRTPAARIIMAVGHYWFRLTPIMCLLVGLSMVITPMARLDMSELSWGLLAIYTACMACHEFAHRNNLCRRCLTAVPPAWGLQTAERRAWLLRLTHWVDARPWVQLLAIVWLLGGLVAYGAGWIPTLAVAAVAVLLWALYSHAEVQHRLLSLWCPQCRPNGAGQGKPAGATPPATR